MIVRRRPIYWLTHPASAPPAMAPYAPTFQPSEVVRVIQGTYTVSNDCGNGSIVVGEPFRSLKIGRVQILATQSAPAEGEATRRPTCEPWERKLKPIKV